MLGTETAEAQILDVYHKLFRLMLLFESQRSQIVEYDTKNINGA